ncbi:hypothetical protein Tco_0156531 [Tanacetum coccineum]
MLNKDNYISWSSSLLCYAKSKPNRKLLVNSIKNGPYIRRMIHEPGDPNSVPPVAESTPAEVDAIRAERLIRTHDPLALMANSHNPYIYLVFHQDQPSPINYMKQPQSNNNYTPQPSFNTNYMQQPMPNPEDISDPTTARNMALNRLIVVPEIANPNVNPNGNGNVVAARELHSQTKEKGWDIDEIEEVNANYILMANLQQASTSYTQTEKSPIYDSDRSAEKMAFEQRSSKLMLQGMTSGQSSSGLELTYASSTITSQKPNERKLDLLFEGMYDDYIGGQPSVAPRTTLTAPAPQVLQTPTPYITTTDNAPTPTTSSSQAANTPNTSWHVHELHQQQHVQQQDNQAQLQPEIVADNVPNAMFDGDVFENPFAPPSTSSVESSSQYVDPLNKHTFYQPY